MPPFSRADSPPLASKSALAVAVVAVLLIATLGSVPVDRSVPPSGAEPITEELEARLERDVHPILGALCIECHAGEHAKGGVRLDELRTLSDAMGVLEDLSDAREMLRFRLMPPKNKPQPTEQQRRVLDDWLGAVLDSAPEAAATIDPGWFTLHRLNRNEYRNTLRDLLGIDPREFDVAERLPRDDTGYGFDNNADVLTVSPLAIEQYIDSAERAIEHALGPLAQPGQRPESILSLQTLSDGKPLPIGGGVLLYANGAAQSVYAFPASGEYDLRVIAWETHAGDDHARMSVRIDGKEVRSFDVSGVEIEPQEFVVPVQIVGGSHRVAACFTNDLWIPNVADRNLAVELIAVSGPRRAEPPDPPKTWREIFGTVRPEENAPDNIHAALQRFAARAYRRPISPEESRTLDDFYDRQIADGQGWERGARTVLQAILSSPSFLSRSVENPRSADPRAVYRLNGYELASRLSYFLWSSTPDGELLRAAADGELSESSALSAQVKRMLADPKSEAFVRNFVGQWMQLRSLETLAIDRARFPEYTDELRADMTTEATLFFADVLRSGESVLTLLRADSSFLNDRLAGLYGVENVTGHEFRSVRFGQGSHRGGILTMAGVLTVTSNTTRTSPVKRGLFVLDQILGKPPPPPPAEIPPLEQAAGVAADATLRERLAAHVANPSCAACHASMDPLGLALENFDAIGRWRDRDNAAPIDARGTLPGGEELSGPDDLKDALLAQADRFVQTLSAKVLTYAIGRGPEPFDRPAVKRITKEVRARGDRLDALIEAVVLSETFRTCRGRKVSDD